MATWNVPMDFAAAAVSATFGATILLGARRDPAKRFLGAFLLLIAANQAADGFRFLATDAGARWTFARYATVFAALDPAMLYAFASLYPSRNALNAPWRMALVLGAGGAIALAVPWMPTANVGTPLSNGLYFGWALYTALVYGVVLVHFARLALRPDGDAGARLFYAALVIAAVPVLPRVVEVGNHLRAALAGDGEGPVGLGAFLLLWALPMLLAAALIARHAARAPAPPEARAAARRAAAAAALLGAIYLVPRGWMELTTAGLVPPPSAVTAALLSNVLFSGSAALRWAAFGVLASTAVLRDRMLDLSLAARRASARVLVGLAFVGVAVAALAAAHTLLSDAFRPSPVDALLLGVALAVSQRFRTGVDRVAERVYGVPAPSASAAYYRRAAGQALADGRDPSTDADLARLARELGLDRDEAAALAAAARGPVGPLLPGQALAGRFRLERLLGRGGAGRAYLARDEVLARPVVVKEVVHDGEGAEAAALAEARAAGAVSHPNVLVVYDVLTGPGASFLVSEHAARGSLQQRLDREGPPPPREAERILDGVLAGLAAVHARGIVHRDVKPGNVLLAEDGTPKLADFGLARLRMDETRSLRPAGVDGTPAYLAPEVRRGERPTPAADVFAVGVLARQLFGGRVPAALEPVVARAVADDPAARWSDAAAMRAAVQASGPR